MTFSFHIVNFRDSDFVRAENAQAMRVTVIRTIFRVRRFPFSKARVRLLRISSSAFANVAFYQTRRLFFFLFRVQIVVAIRPAVCAADCREFIDAV